jgi:antitoxin HicB
LRFVTVSRKIGKSTKIVILVSPNITPFEDDLMNYRVIIETDEDGMFVVAVPSLPGCLAQGSTRAEAIANVREAIQAYLESLNKHGDPVPPPISEEIVEVSA